ncbi:hypothetical protein [Burkholderia stagnalis]|uniref:hypothetical protein n=1 Tax=Burkholderia stagnalis TaxID=1503054 RepID=UPI000F57690B|nr:hypothetical protein [Burkholderia stagnalis]RQR11327.1 hypothetical protein DF025_17330 [Burkholderia stagnalis]RQR20354.1 hypothetical protein DF026_17135 [Burkholderia stagnalis]
MAAKLLEAATSYDIGVQAPALTRPEAAGSRVKERALVTKKEAPPNYDYTGAARVERERKALAEAGGARVEAHLDADEVLKLDALAGARFKGSRRAALKHLVQQLPEPKKKA